MQRFGVLGRGASSSAARVARNVLRVVGTLLVWTSPLWAKEPSPGKLATARRLFAEATALEASSDWNAAASKLKSALSIKETPGLRYHLAHCEEQRGALVAASADYERAAQLIRSGAPAPDVAPLLPLAQRRIDSRVAKLDLVVPPGVPALAEVDGRLLPATTFGTSLRLDPGPHRVSVRAAGEADFQADLTLGTGEHRTLKVFFHDGADADPAQVPSATALASDAPSAPRGSAPQAPVRSDHGSRSGLRTGVLAGEAALTLAGLGAGFGYALARDDASAAVLRANATIPPGDERYCVENAATQGCANVAAAVEHFDRVVRRERIGFITAGAAAGLLLATWVLWPASPQRPAIAVSPSPGGALLYASGAF
jgi:hypothetical protein